MTNNVRDVIGEPRCGLKLERVCSAINIVNNPVDTYVVDAHIPWWVLCQYTTLKEEVMARVDQV
jgi:hypothetical protein